VIVGQTADSSALSHFALKAVKMEEPSSEVVGLLKLLIDRYLPTANKGRLLSFALRLLSSKIKPAVQDECALADLMTRKLSAVASSETKAFQEAWIRLRELKALKNRWGVLCLLHKLDVDCSISIPAKCFEPFVHESLADIKRDAVKLVSADANYLLRDVIFAFQGIDGQYITYSILEDSYVVQPNLGVSEPVRKMVCELCEMGWLFRKVTEFVSRQLEDLSSGLLMQSLCFALQTELVEYYNLLALIEQQHTHLTTVFSLKKLYLWCEEPLERLKWLAIIVDSANGLKGGALLSAVNSYSQHGNPRIGTLIERIVGEVAAPLLSMIKSWMTEGELNDPYREFFITADFSVPDEGLWVERYSVSSHMVPASFDAALTQKIFLTGKSINFLRRCCEIEDFDMPADILDFSCLVKWGEAAAERVNSRLVAVMFDKYRFLGHCDSMRKYLLLAQGDLHHTLMELLSDELKERAKRVYKHNIVSILESAVRASNAQHHDSEFINRLDVRLAPGEPGDIGWDVFSLEYRVDKPLNTIFTPDNMDKYQALFRFLWKIKRVEFALKTKAFRQMRPVLEMMNYPDIRPHLIQCQALQHEIGHFVSNFLNYLLIEVVESSWIRFCSEVVSVSDLDALIHCHAKYLIGLMNRAFLGPQTEAIYRQVLRLLELAQRFAYTQEALYLSCEEEANRRRNLRLADLGEDEYTSLISHEAIIDLQELAKVFEESLSTFQGLLEESDRGYLKFLAFRLDFSEYYEGLKYKREVRAMQTSVLKSIALVSKHVV
jgi:gamma-tubulin complex component 3